jgi:hypothetical protein
VFPGSFGAEDRAWRVRGGVFLRPLFLLPTRFEYFFDFFWLLDSWMGGWAVDGVGVFIDGRHGDDLMSVMI